MSAPSPIWLVVNDSSGSNSPRALEELQSCLAEHGFPVQRLTRFPADDLPDAATLATEAIPTVAVYAGDGTVNACISRLYGWEGAVLVLPGGTMNMLSQRLHREADMWTIVERVAAGAARTVRPSVVRCRHGDAFAGFLAGPGTAWGDVREAMREVDIGGIVETASDALSRTTGGSMVHCREPALGRTGGYPLLELTPGEWGVQIDAFHAESAGEFVQQGWALLRRRFREGPHDRLGLVDKAVLEDSDKDGIGILIDGEAVTGGSREEIAVARCEVDLLATGHGN